MIVQICSFFYNFLLLLATAKAASPACRVGDLDFSSTGSIQIASNDPSESIAWDISLCSLTQDLCPSLNPGHGVFVYLIL